MLNVLEYLPDGLLVASVNELDALLGGPTLIHLPGRREAPLFVSVLLHGNEDSGFYAMQSLLQDYRDRELPRALSLFIGNVSAARHGLRRLDGQPDYNRVWPGAEGSSPEHAMMAEVVDELRARRVFASVDIHNNTGLNPHYACINRVENHFLHLATLFSRTVVYFIRPRGVQSLAMAQLCPAVTVECGLTGQARGIAHAREYIEACMNMAELPASPVAMHDIDLFHTVATVRVPDEFSIGFGEGEADIHFHPDLDHFNFRELPEGTVLAHVNEASAVPGLQAWDEDGQPVDGRYFHQSDGTIATTRPVMPSMFTVDERVIRQDCLGYLMERYPLQDSRD